MSVMNLRCLRILTCWVLSSAALLPPSKAMSDCTVNTTTFPDWRITSTAWREENGDDYTAWSGVNTSDLATHFVRGKPLAIRITFCRNLKRKIGKIGERKLLFSDWKSQTIDKKDFKKYALERTTSTLINPPSLPTMNYVTKVHLVDAFRTLRQSGSLTHRFS